MKLCRIYYATAFEFQNLADNDTLKEVTVQICMLKFIQSNEGSLSDVRKLNKPVIDKQMSSHPWAGGTAHGMAFWHGQWAARHGSWHARASTARCPVQCMGRRSGP